MSYALTDMDRRLANVVSIGRIAAVDPARGMAQVDMDGVLTDWIPWAVPQAGGNRTWSCPDVGEQVVVAAQGGELSEGVIIGSLFQDNHPEPADSGDVTRTVYQDGTVVEQNRATSGYLVDVPAGGTLTLRCGGSSIVISDAGVKITGPRIDLD